MTKATLLIVEDNGILASHLKEMVIGLGYDALGPASTGEEAIDLVGRHPVDLVLMDIELAGAMNGIEASTRIHAILDVPVVFLTGFSQDQYIEQATQASPYGYLVKPVTERDLAAVLTTSLHRHALDRQLRESRLALEASESNFRNFFHSMTDLLLVADDNGRILDANASLLKTLGYDQRELTARSTTELYPPHRRREAEQALAMILQGQGDECRIPMQSKIGHPVPVATRVWRGWWNGAACLYVASRDLSGEQEAVQRFFEAVFRRNPMVMSLRTIDDHRFLDVNDAWLNTLGYARHEVIGRTVQDLNLAFHPEDYARGMNQLRRHGRLTNHDMQARRKDGSLCDGLLSTEIVSIADREYVLTVMLDLSERRELQHQLLMASEQEREWLAAELHDGLCQELKGLEFQAAMIEHRVGKRNATVRALASELGRQANLAVKKAYAIAKGMLPTVMDTAHFPKALAALADAIQDDAETRIALSVQEDVLPATLEQAHHLYRIAQEGLRNAARHAEATRIDLRWFKDGDDLILAIADNGIGLKPGPPGQGRGMGLMAMRSRARAINAFFTVEQQANRGTEIRIKVRHDQTNQSIPH